MRFLCNIRPSGGPQGTAVAALTAAGVLWGLTVPLSKLALDWLGPAWLTVGRFAVAAPLLAVVARRQLRSAVTPAVGACGALGYGAVILAQNAGLERTSVSHAALIVGVVPVLVAGITAAAGRGAAGPVAWLGFVLALSGVGLVAGGGGGSASTGGDALVLLSVALSAAAISVQPRLLADRDPVAVTAVQLGAGALLALPAAIASEGLPPAPPVPGSALAAAVLVSTAGTLLPFALFAFGQAQVEPELAGAFINLEPLVGAIAGAAAFGDEFGLSQLAGGLVLVTGIALSARPRRRPPRATEPRAAPHSGSGDLTAPDFDCGRRRGRNAPRIRARARQPGQRRVRVRRERPPSSRTGASGARRSSRPRPETSRQPLGVPPGLYAEAVRARPSDRTAVIAADGFDGLAFSSEERPPADPALAQRGRKPHHQVDRHAAQRAGHADVSDAASAGAPNFEHFPAHVPERTANRFPPCPDAIVAAKGRSLDLGDERRELDVVGGQRQETVEVARVERAEGRLGYRAQLRVVGRHRGQR